MTIICQICTFTSDRNKKTKPYLSAPRTSCLDFHSYVYAVVHT